MTRRTWWRAWRHAQLARVLCGVLCVGLAVAGCGSRRGAPPNVPAPEAMPTPAAPTPAPPTPAPPVVAVVSPAQYPPELQRRMQELARSESERLGAGDVGYYMDVQQARLQQIGQARVLVERQNSRLVVTVVGATTFEVGSTQLTSDATATLDQLASVLADYDRTMVSVHGHTDASGDEQANLRLSERRALAVAEFLLGRGVGRERLVAVGHGSTKNVASNDTAEGRDRNRRIELHLDPVVVGIAGGR